MKKIVYVAGKVSGLSNDDVKQKFDRITDELSDLGYTVLKPVSVMDHSRPWKDCMRTDINKMLQCDEVHLLPCWTDSYGARLERDIALRMGINVVYH